MSEQKLRECPFCGKQPTDHKNGKVSCSHEFCVCYGGRFDALRWNTRATVPPVADSFNAWKILTPNIEAEIAGAEGNEASEIKRLWAVIGNALQSPSHQHYVHCNANHRLPIGSDSCTCRTYAEGLKTGVEKEVVDTISDGLNAAIERFRAYKKAYGTDLYTEASTEYRIEKAIKAIAILSGKGGLE